MPTSHSLGTKLMRIVNDEFMVSADVDERVLVRCYNPVHNGYRSFYEPR